MPVEPEAKDFATFEFALADDAAVDHRGGVGPGFGAGEAEAGNVAAVRESRQPAFLLLPGAEAHQELARPERVRDHDRDGSGDRAGRDLAHHFRMRVGREAEAAKLLRNDHAEEFLVLDEVPDVRRQVAPFPKNLPLVEHGAELVDGAIKEGLLLVGQPRLRHLQQLRPVRVAGEEIGVPPDVAGLQRLTLGIGHRRQHAAGPGEDRLCQGVAAEAHGGPHASARLSGILAESGGDWRTLRPQKEAN